MLILPNQLNNAIIVLVVDFLQIDFCDICQGTYTLQFWTFDSRITIRHPWSSPHIKYVKYAKYAKLQHTKYVKYAQFHVFCVKFYVFYIFCLFRWGWWPKLAYEGIKSVPSVHLSAISWLNRIVISIERNKVCWARILTWGTTWEGTSMLSHFLLFCKRIGSGNWGEGWQSHAFLEYHIPNKNWLPACKNKKEKVKKKALYPTVWHQLPNKMTDSA